MLIHGMDEYRSSHPPRIIAHRGASGEGLAPENTLAAFRLALDMGADLIELDVHRTRDGHVVVIHDAALDRTTDCTGAISDRTLGEILPADAGGGERVPTLHEALALIRDHAVVLVEIKPEDITADVIRTIREAEAVEYTVLQSFHPRVVAEGFALAPEIPRALLIGQGTVTAGRAASLGAGVVVPAWGMVNDRLTRAMHRRGLGVWTYTVDDEATMHRMAEAGVDGIITNYPDRLKKALSTGF